MTKGILTNKQLKELVLRPEYTYKEVERHHIPEFEKFNKWAPQEVYNLFDIMTKANEGIPPTPEEYLDTAVQKTKEFWYKDSDEGRLTKWTMGPHGWESTYLTWSEGMEKAVRWRLSRMYQSMMSELSALSTIHELLPDAYLFTSKDIDLVLGVDIVIALKTSNIILYTHVAKDSSWVEQNLTKKANRSVPAFSKHNTKHIWNRRWSNSHMVFRYDLFDSVKTEMVNGHALFKEEYVREVLTNKLQEDNLDHVQGQSEFSDFHNFLTNFNINQEGIVSMVTHVGR